MDIREYLKDSVILSNGATGSMLQAMGLGEGDRTELWNITHPKEVIAVHKSYYDAGSNTVTTNTFGASFLKYSDDELEDIVKAAVETARIAMEESSGDQPKCFSMNIGPSGAMLAPVGTLLFDEAKAGFAKLARLGTKYGADYIYIETMNDIEETRAAVEAAKENSDLPIIVSNTYTKHKRLLTGARPSDVVSMLEDLKVDGVGINCSLGPKQMLPILEEYLKLTDLPVLFKPNAGLPEWRPGGIAAYNVGPEEFAKDVAEAAKMGAKIIGGCCGTTPEYIKELAKQIR